MTESDSSAGTPPQVVDLRCILITLCATLGSAIYSFTWNSVTVALPHMKGAFSATTDQIAWVMIAFVIGSALMTASIGWFSDRYGRRRMFLLSIAGYAVTLLGCGLSTTLAEMVAWRFVQGAFGAGLIPLGQAIAVNAFPPDRHSQATSLWALGFVSSNVISPTVAGVIIEDWGWPWIFYAVLPVAAVVFVATWILVPTHTKNPRKIDWIGFGALLIGVSVLQLMLARGERLDWFDSTEVVTELVITIIGISIFLLRQLGASHPFIDRALFLDRDYVLGLVFIFMIGAVMFLPMLLTPLLLQQVAGYSAIDTGYLMLPRGLGSIIGLVIMSRIRDHTDPRPILACGLLLLSFSAWSMGHWTVEVRSWDVGWTNFLHGLASGAIWAPLNTLTLGKLSRRLQDQSIGLFYLCFDMGSAIGTAAVVGLHGRFSQVNRAELSALITPFTDPIRLQTLPESWSLTELAGLAAIEQEVSRQALMIAFNNSFQVIALVVLTLVPIIMVFKNRRSPLVSD